MKIKVIIPRGLLLDPARLVRGLENGLTAAAKATKIDFDVTTQTWRKRPDFTIKDQPSERIIATDNEIYGYVNDGTRPHIIVAKNGKSLAFKWGGKGSYSPKTAVRVIGSGASSQSGSIIRPRAIHHPGTDAREFDQVIADKWEDKLPEIVQRAIDSEVD